MTRDVIETPWAGIVVESVSRSYQRGSEVVLAIDDVSLQLEPARMTALVGPSGSGKTTLLDMVMGESRPDRGTVSGLTDRPTWNDLSIVPQQLGLLSELTIGENVRLPLRLGARPHRDPDDLLESLGIAELAGRFPHETSLGQQQRAAVARALVSGSRAMIVDEPTSHQDEKNVGIVADSLVQAARTGSLVLVATHDDRVIERCDHAVHLVDGRLSRADG